MTQPRLSPLLAAALLTLVVPVSVAAQALGGSDPAGTDVPPTATSDLAHVAVVARPPFAYRLDGVWTGLGVELWRQVAGTELTVVEHPSDAAAVAALVAGRATVAIGVSPQAAPPTVGVGYPYLVTGHGVAVRHERTTSLGDLVRLFFSLEVLKMVGGLLGVAFVIGIAMWALERRLEDSEHFGENPKKGIGTGIWWAAVTMTGVGYGDTTPRTPGGRAAAVTWMLISLVLVAGFTATVTSKLTLSGFTRGIATPSDLGEVPTAVVAGESTAEYLRSERVESSSVPSLDEGLRQLGEEEVAALVHPRPELCFAVDHQAPSEIRVLPTTFGRLDHAFLFAPEIGARRHEIDAAIRGALAADGWGELVFEHLGCRG